MSLRLDPRASLELYPQLDLGARTIRLIEILPGDFSALPIHCELVEKQLTPSLAYKALSYSWKNGDAAPDVAIFCNSTSIYISANLHAALRRLRAPNGVVRIWVDAICINQQDAVERAHQVGMMRDIYQNSSEVLIWLGESGPHDDLGDWIWEKVGKEGGALRRTHDNPNIVQWFGDKRDIPKLEAYFSSIFEAEADKALRFEGQRCDIVGAFCVLHLLASGVPVDKIWHLRHIRYSASIVNGINAIMDKAWWRRIWVVQETVVAKTPIIYYGNMCAPWRLFALAAVGYDTGRVRDNLEGVLSHLKSGYSLMQFTRVIMEIESTRRGWEKREPMVPLTVLRKFRSRLATDPRDKVFAVLGLIRSWGTEKSGEATEGITPDYTVKDYQIFLKTTELLIRNRRSLAVLAGTLQRSSGQSSMPSWVTDWNCLPGVNEHIRLGNYQLYDAAAYLSGSVALHGRSILETQACLVDEVDYVGRVLENGQGRNRARLTILEWQKYLPRIAAITGDYIGGGSVYAAFWRTLCSDVEFVQYADRSEYVREFRRLPEQATKNEAYERWLTVDEYSNRRTSLVGGIWLEPTNSETETESKNAFQYLLECASGERRFFRTKRGYIGTGPVETSRGDSVVVLLGSQVPFILREDEQSSRRCFGQDIKVLFSEKSSYQAGQGAKVLKDEKIRCYGSHEHCYRVIGDAYVHGIMNGDARLTNQWGVEPIYLGKQETENEAETDEVSFNEIPSYGMMEYKNPKHPFNQDPYVLRSITVQSYDVWGAKRIGFLKLQATITNSAGESLPGGVFLRGPSVGMLVMLIPDDVAPAKHSQDEKSVGPYEEERYVLLTIQPRVAAGSLAFAELPAGMVDDDAGESGDGKFAGTAAREIYEELGIEIPASELVCLSDLAQDENEASQKGEEEGLHPPCTPLLAAVMSSSPSTCMSVECLATR
ncbi:hypothetical protein NUW58_g4326 [Xylaria curta]|uniref:Uncharacterized protein n=1 Tax=Xylaria curta TaxID=42375 RepID=A0ACC1P892_9PEZI|nr:hypothetical protein NUW58_g4326 [Xylaria curta]